MARDDQLKAQWAAQAARALVGRKITVARYMNQQEQRASMWDRSGIVLELDDGTAIFPAADDEGNGPGALFTTRQDLPIIPVI